MSADELKVAQATPVEAETSDVTHAVAVQALLEVDDDFEGDDESTEEGRPDLLDAIKNRCDAAQIQYEVSTDPNYPFITVSIPAGRDKRQLYVSGPQRAEQLLSTKFEKISYVGNYEAICNYEEGYIEAVLGNLGPVPAVSRFRELLGTRHSADLQDGNPRTIAIGPPENHPNIELTISLSSDRIAPFVRRLLASRRPILSIRNLEITSNERAVDLLETIANSLLFEIDLRFSIPLTLLRERRLVGSGKRRLDIGKELQNRPLQFPSTVYDKAALSLYWYGRSAAGLPLLRFLAFYQSLEYYFPIYSQIEAIRQTRKTLKDPRFSIHDDADMTKLVNSIQTSRSGALGDERTQFRAVINACVEANAIKEFLQQDTLRTFYTDAKEWKQLSKVKIPINEIEGDLRDKIAERLYDIRCRIVHAKSDGGQSKSDALLPFSREAEQLAADTEVMQYISTQVLIASSNKLSF